MLAADEPAAARGRPPAFELLPPGRRNKPPALDEVFNSPSGVSSVMVNVKVDVMASPDLPGPEITQKA